MSTWEQIAILREENRAAEAERLRRLEQASAEQIDDELQFQSLPGQMDTEPSPAVAAAAVPSIEEKEQATAAAAAPRTNPVSAAWTTANPFRQPTQAPRSRDVFADELKAREAPAPSPLPPTKPPSRFYPGSGSSSGREAWKQRLEEWQRVREEKSSDGVIDAIHAFLEGLISIFDVKSVASVMHEDLLKFGRRRLLDFLKQRQNGDWRVLVASRYHQAIEAALTDVRDRQFREVSSRFQRWTDTELLLQPQTGAAIRKLILYHWETIKKEKSGAYQQKRAADTLDDTWQTGMKQLINSPRILRTTFRAI